MVLSFGGYTLPSIPKSKLFFQLNLLETENCRLRREVDEKSELIEHWIRGRPVGGGGGMRGGGGGGPGHPNPNEHRRLVDGVGGMKSLVYCIIVVMR